ncbi:MAG: hypothetical protein WCP20_10980 [Desulfuromonadales bacterium]
MAKIIRLSDVFRHIETPGKSRFNFNSVLAIPFRVLLAVLLPLVTVGLSCCGLLSALIERITGVFPVDFKATIKSARQ